MGNAVKFTEQGEVVVRVRQLRAETQEEPAEIEVEVTDTGIGIPEDRVPQLFAPFSQADASTTRKYGGTGLGLAICKLLVEAMAGSISARSTVGEGTAMTFTFRARKAPRPAAQPMATAEDMAGKEVLVVDDNETNRRVLCGQLTTWGFSALGRESAAQALETMEQEPRFDLAILDLNMPGVDGLTLAHQIREFPQYRDLPLILLSSSLVQAKDDPDHLFLSRLIKPVRQSRLFDSIMGAFGTYTKVATVVPQGAEPRRIGDETPMNILVADDNEVNRSVAALVLRRFGLDTDFAVNGRDAIDRVVARAPSSDPYDLVFMDVHMPGLDGLDATRCIRRLEKERPDQGWPRVVAMTADAMKGDREICLEAGMQDYLTKPLDFEAVESVLEQAAASLKGPRRASLSAPAELPSPEPEETNVEPEEVMDWSRLDELRGYDTPDGAMVNRLLSTFVTQVATQLEEVRVGAEQNDGQALRASAHVLKGAATNIGATQVAAYATQLEEAGKTSSFEGVESMVEGLSRALLQTLVELHEARGGSPELL